MVKICSMDLELVTDFKVARQMLQDPQHQELQFPLLQHRGGQLLRRLD